jgi:hypothetical protein
MKTTFKEHKEFLQSNLYKRYYTPTCEHCKNKLFISIDEMDKVLFEPKEIETERIVIELLNGEKIERKAKTVPYKQIVSSDINKDFYEFTCPVCGELQKITYEDLIETVCSFYGDNNKRFELDEVETTRAKEFIKEHNHIEEFRKMGKFGFSALGQQFTYNITPGGLGNSVTIICNHCKEQKGITNIDNW